MKKTSDFGGGSFPKRWLVSSRTHRPGKTSVWEKKRPQPKMTNNENIESRFWYYPFVTLVQLHILNQVDDKKIWCFSESCPPEWIKEDEMCFLYKGGSFTFHEAEKYCWVSTCEIRTKDWLAFYSSSVSSSYSSSLVKVVCFLLAKLFINLLRGCCTAVWLAHVRTINDKVMLLSNSLRKEKGFPSIILRFQ